MRWSLLSLLMACGRLEFDAVVADSSLIASYPLDTCDLAVDAIGGLDGSCAVGQCPVPTPAPRGTGCEFDGSDDRFLVPFDNRLQLTSGFTISLWFSARTPAAHDTLIAKFLATGSGASFELFRDIGADTGLSLCTTGTMEDCMPSGVVAALGAWTHVAVTWDGTRKAIYVDGVEVAGKVAATTFDNSGMLIGGDSEDGVFRGAFPGTLDDLLVFDRALSATEVSQLVR